jgi:hypothetical protein
MSSFDRASLIVGNVGDSKVLDSIFQRYLDVTKEVCLATNLYHKTFSGCEFVAEKEFFGRDFFSFSLKIIRFSRAK